MDIYSNYVLLNQAVKIFTFDNFETVLLEFKTVYHMTGNLGRVRRNSILMCTGNGQVLRHVICIPEHKRMSKIPVSRVLWDSQ